MTNNTGIYYVFFLTNILIILCSCSPVGGWSSFFSGEDFLVFRASTEDIEKFIVASSSIKDSSPGIFNSEHMYLPSPEDPNLNSENYYKHEYNYVYCLHINHLHVSKFENKL